MRLEWVPLSELAEWPGNPKAHDDELISRSFSRFGYIDPMIFDETTKRLVVGHGRRANLLELRNAGAVAPDRVEVREDGEWLVPVIRGVAFKSAADAEAYLLLNNQATIKGGYNEQALVEMLQRHQEELDDIGWSKEESDDLIKRVSSMIADAPSAPEDFKEFDEGQKDGHDCPQCGFRVVCEKTS